MAVTKYNPIQRDRISRLEPKLMDAVEKGDLALIKSLISDLQHIYLPTGNEAKLLMAKNRWFEIEMNQGNYATAERGLDGIRIKANKATRVYLEATTLLAICLIRMDKIEKAEPLIRDVLKNDKVIKSLERRLEFRNLAIERFDEEAILYAIKSERIHDVLEDLNEIEIEAKNLATKKTIDQLYENLGFEIPKGAKDILVRVDAFSKKQLPSAERLKLPSPILNYENKKIGKTVFSSVKRALYKSLCDKEGDLNKKIQNGLVGLQTSLTVIIAETFNSLNLGLRILAVNVIALVIKLGLDTFCDMYKPIDVMNLRP